MDIYKLAEQTQTRGFTHAFKIVPADLTEETADTDQTIALMTVTAGVLVQNAALRIVDALEDASDSAFNSTKLSVGDGVVTNRFLQATEVNENGTEVNTVISGNSISTIPYAYTAGDTIDLLVESMSAKSLSDIDTGEVWIYLHITDLDEITKG